jgi:hypothetical protein
MWIYWSIEVDILNTVPWNSTTISIIDFYFPGTDVLPFRDICYLFLIHKLFLTKNLTIHPWLALKSWIPCCLLMAKAFNWHTALDAAHPNCCFSHILRSFFLFQHISFSCHEKPSNYHSPATSTLSPICSLLYHFHSYCRYFLLPWLSIYIDPALFTVFHELQNTINACL